MSGAAGVGLTQRQYDALQFIRGFIAANGYGPSFAEIRAGIGASSNSTVHRLVHGLQERGAIRFFPGHGRSIAVQERA